MAVKNVVGLFDTTQDAHEAVRDLRDAGISSDDISFIARNEETTVVEETDGGSEAAEGAGFGATGGTVIGGLTGLLVGLGALVIPGIGPVIAAGSIATALGTTALGAGIGAAAGGLLGALAGAGIPEEDANIYSEGIRRGGALVMAKVDEPQVETVLDVMERHNVIDIDDRGRSYRDEGWAQFEGDPAYAAAGTGTAVADETPLDADAYERSSKAGTAGGAVAGAATGAAIGSVGGPVGTVVGGVAGAVTGGAVGAAGDTAGQAADEADETTDYSAVDSEVVTADYSAVDSGVVTTDDDVTVIERETLVEDDVVVGETTYADSTADRIYDTTMTADTGVAGSTAAGDADRTVDGDDYERSSKVGTAGGALAGAATGAAIGSVGGPVGTVVGGVAGAVTGGGVGAAGDAAATEATDDDTTASSSNVSSDFDSAIADGPPLFQNMDDDPNAPRVAGGTTTTPIAGETTAAPVEPTTDDKPGLGERLTNTGERLFNKDLDDDGDVGAGGRRNP